MKKLLLYPFAGCMLALSCHRPNNNNNTTTVTETQVINDFVAKVVLPQYQALQDKATALNNAVNTFNTTPNGANLSAARTAWRETRACWENCEGFLIGPVEDDNYDPNMDTWPVDYLQLDSFIANSSSFSVGTVAALSQSLRGFHPLEYILWGKDGNVAVEDISSRQHQYMVALAQDVLNNCTALNLSWVASGGNFQVQFLTAGTGSTRYTTKKDALLALAAGMAEICGEVGEGKMLEPFQLMDSTKTESPFSHNSMTDFTNNIKGAQNVYLCTVNGANGSSLSNLVSQKNLSLDNKIKTQFAAAIAALGNVTVSFESALYTQRTQLQTAMTAITNLEETLDGDLKTFIITYVKD